VVCMCVGCVVLCVCVMCLCGECGVRKCVSVNMCECFVCVV